MARTVTIQHHGPAEFMKSTAPLPYTINPWRLFVSDMFLFMTNVWTLPNIVWPVTPCNSGKLDELHPSCSNIFDITVHVILSLAQLVFLISVPLCAFFPVPFGVVILYMVGFLTINHLLCKVLLNGSKPTLESKADISHFPETHEDERWVFLVSYPQRHFKCVKFYWQLVSCRFCIS
jgi:hypothetical protein